MEDSGLVVRVADKKDARCNNLRLTEKGKKLSKYADNLFLNIDEVTFSDFTEEEIARRESSFGILSQKLAARITCDMMKHWELPVKGVKGWKAAQCTGGGVVLDQINADTAESKLIEGLYITGELLDYKGPCGGFNLQNAWETGMKAAADLNRKFK